MEDCESCKNFDETTICLECNSGSNFEEVIVTNAERIRSMSDEELAGFLCKISSCHPNTCPAYTACMSKVRIGMKYWLQSEVKGSE